MRALVLLAFLGVWVGFALGAVGLAVHLVVSTIRPRPPRPGSDGPTLLLVHSALPVEQVLAVAAVFAAVYATAVGGSFLLGGDLGGFGFAAGPAVAFAVLATTTSRTLRRRRRHGSNATAVTA